MAQNSALARVMDQAQQASSNFTPNDTGNLPAVQQSSVPANRPSLTSLVDSAGISVDEYLTVKEGGFRLGDMKGYFNEFEAELDMTEVVSIFQVRANRGGQTTFIKSYDGVMTPQGQNFQQATAQLQSSHEKVDGPYQTAEIPVTLLNDVTDGKVTVEAGTTVGITPSITGVKFFTKFVKKLRSEGLEDATVKVKIIHTPQSNAKGNEWGVCAFELISD